MLVDTHCHVYNEYYDDIDEVIERAINVGVRCIIVNGVDRKSNEEILELVKKYDIVYGALGIQPEEVEKVKAEDLKFIEEHINDEKIQILGGQPNTGVANTEGFGNLPKYGVPNIMTVDGPAGVRINRECGVFTTAFPCATALACSWNLDMMEEIGQTGAKEALENNLGIWLTPAMNIHRSPLCGRNFEYFSEDPFVTGKMAAAKVHWLLIQSMQKDKEDM